MQTNNYKIYIMTRNNNCLVVFYCISTLVGYLMPNLVYTYILNIYDLDWFYDVSTTAGYLVPNHLYTQIY